MTDGLGRDEGRRLVRQFLLWCALPMYVWLLVGLAVMAEIAGWVSTGPSPFAVWMIWGGMHMLLFWRLSRAVANALGPSA